MTGSSIHVLVVDARRADILYLRSALEVDPLHPVVVSHAGTLADALAQVRCESVDVVLLNLNLPDSQGIATIEHVQRLAPQLPIIVWSESSAEDEAIAAMRAGAQDFLSSDLSGLAMPGRVIRHAIERQKLRIALAESELRFATVFHTSPAAQLITTLEEGQILDANLAFCQLVGYVADEIIGATVQTLNLWAIPHDRQTMTRQLRADGHIRDLETTLRMHTGDLRTVLVSFEPIRVQGKACTISTALDITERKRADVALHHIIARMRALHAIDHAILAAQSPPQMAAVVIAHLRLLLPCDQAAVLIDDAEHLRLQILAADDTAAEPASHDALIAISAWYRDHSGLPPRPWRVADGRHTPQLASHTDAAALPAKGALLVVPLLAQGTLIGTLVLGSVAPDGFDDEHVAITSELADQLAIGLQAVLLRDQLVQERVQLAQRVAERTRDLSMANVDLARAARLKDEFLASMSHELRTPLTAILGRAELLREQIYGPLTERQQQAIQAMETSGQHLLMLINDILDLSKIEAGKVELQIDSVEIDPICLQSRQIVAESAMRKRISLTTMIDPQVTVLQADARRLKQILVNLLANAVKFTPEGGQVGLEVRGDAERQVVAFTVWDTGIGIALEDQRRLFQPFVQIDSTLSRQYAGTGLGLATVLRLAELHGGSVALESALGAGSRFSVTLPWVQPTDEADTLAPAPHLERAPLDAAAPADPGIPPMILLAEDHAENIQLLNDVLTNAGYTVVVARNGADAVIMAQDLRPALILMDIQMPVLNGLEATQRLRAVGLRDTPIIALTALAMAGDRERCLAAGANAYMAKPVGPRELVETITRLLKS